MNIIEQMQQGIPLAPYTTFHIGGPAQYFVSAHNPNDLITAVSWAREQQLPFFVLGQGANILVGDKGFAGLVIKNETKAFTIFSNPPQDQQGDDFVLLTAESGATIESLILATAAVGLSGLEHFAGIPSSLGGALWQNLHFLSPDRATTVFIGDMLQSAQILTETGEVKTVPKEYFQFGYDTSILHSNKDVVLYGALKMKKSTKEAVEEVIQDNLAWRNTKHPHEAWKKSAGSVFKKIEGHGAGRLIEQAGLKGKQIGGAQVSPQHANFIINMGGATAKDVRLLISLIQNEVKKHTGLHLYTEISFIGEF